MRLNKGMKMANFQGPSCHVVLIIFSWLAISSTTAGPGKSSIPGHKKALGFNRKGGGVTVIFKFSSPIILYMEFVKKSQPIWMGKALVTVNHPGLMNWTNEYLKYTYGDVPVKVEMSKKENRHQAAKTLTLRQFLNRYEKENIYLVHSLRNTMDDMVLIPPSLQCGGFERVIQDAVLWMGSGKTSSVLHYDDLDNLLCLFDGQKDVILIDPIYKDGVEADGFVQDGGYSLVDVDEVDMEKFPRLSNLSWKQVTLTKGDCLYIPKRWYHQVTSSTARHLAINFWFSHLYWLNTTDCLSESDSSVQSLRSISDFGYASPNEFLRSRLLDQLFGKELLTKYNFVDFVSSSTIERRERFFDAIDMHQDSVLSWGELYGFDIDNAVLHFPDIFDLPGAIQDMPEDFVLYKTAYHGQCSGDNHDPNAHSYEVEGGDLSSDISDVPQSEKLSMSAPADNIVNSLDGDTAHSEDGTHSAAFWEQDDELEPGRNQHEYAEVEMNKKSKNKGKDEL